MHRSGGLPGEGKIGILAPDGKGTRDFLIDIGGLKSLRILGDLVGEVLHTPATALEGITLRATVGGDNTIPDAATWQ